MRKFVALGLLFVLVACATSTQSSALLLGTYDAAASAELLYLDSGKATPAEAVKLKALRLQASAAVQQLVAAEKAGGNTAAYFTAAQLAINAFLTESNLAKGAP